MGIGNRNKSDELMRQHTNKNKDNNNNNNDIKEIKKELEINPDFNYNFDIGDNNIWYISYDDALLAICSELIGPRLPDGFEMFQIYNPTDFDEIIQLKIDEWYMLKYNCYDVWKAIKLSIEQKKTIY